MVNVQFSDASETKVIAYFGAPQDPAVYPNQGEIASSDARWTAFYNSMSPSVQAGIPAPSGS